MTQLAITLKSQGRLSEAEELQTWPSMINLACIKMKEQGRIDDAAEKKRHVMEKCKKS
jgi:hypothetical protein